jgi:hypothetical protein
MDYDEKHPPLRNKADEEEGRQSHVFSDRAAARHMHHLSQQRHL